MKSKVIEFGGVKAAVQREIKKHAATSPTLRQVNLAAGKWEVCSQCREQQEHRAATQCPAVGEELTSEYVLESLFSKSKDEMH